MVKFGTFEGNSANLSDLGTLASVVGKGGKIAFIRKNYNDPAKRIALLLTNAKGETAIVSCSKQVSDSLRKKELTVANLVGLNVVENEEGIAFVSMPATGAIQEFAVNNIKAKAVEVETTEFLPHELIA